MPNPINKGRGLGTTVQGLKKRIEKNSTKKEERKYKMYRSQQRKRHQNLRKTLMPRLDVDIGTQELELVLCSCQFRYLDG